VHLDSSLWHQILRAAQGTIRLQLGFDGERYVGEALTPLVADGFEIYHDSPFEGFNIDHVLARLSLLAGAPACRWLEIKCGFQKVCPTFAIPAAL